MALGVLMAIALLAAVFWPPVSARIQHTSYPLKYEPQVEHWAAEFGLDPYLVYAFILTESSFDPLAESGAGARGLMQMTEDTFDWIKTRLRPEEELGFEDLFDPDVSIRFGCRYLSLCLERYGGDISTAAAAYHSGWGTVDGLLEKGDYSDDGVRLKSFPHRQMNHYVYKINRNYDKYIEIYTKDT